jgi:phenylalanyl-tRNA synthetase beta chain
MVVFGENEDFFTLKGIVEGILNNFCANRRVQFVRSNQPFLHPTRCADILIDGEVVGYLGQIHPSIIEKLDADKPVFGAEISYSKLSAKFNEKISFKPISKFPIVERDLAIIIDNGIDCASIEDIIKKAGGKYLESVKLFDIYQGAQIGEGKKSMAFNLIFVAEDRTLNVEEVDNMIKKILKSLSFQLGAQLR